MEWQQTCSGRFSKLPLLSSLTNVEEQDGPDRKSQSPQVALGVRTPLKAHCQHVTHHHSTHLSDKIIKKHKETSDLSMLLS